MKRILAVLTILVMTAALFAAPAFAEEGEEEAFASWNPDAPALKALIEYVEDVTDEASPNYIPEGDRIATFDMDGTLCGELYPTYLEYYLLARLSALPRPNTRTARPCQTPCQGSFRSATRQPAGS